MVDTATNRLFIKVVNPCNNTEGFHISIILYPSKNEKELLLIRMSYLEDKVRKIKKRLAEIA